MPMVFSETSLPLKNRGAQPSKPLVRDNSSPSTIRLATLKIRPMVKSAVALVEAFGVFVTSIPFHVHSLYLHY